MGVTALFVLAAVFAFNRPAAATPVEFCPAAVTDFSAAQPSGVYGFELGAAAPRKITGSLAIETDRGWFRAPFKPQSLGVVYVRFPQPLQVLNAWLGAAASDDPQWSSHGVVSCPPQPRPDLKREKALPGPPPDAAIATAVATKPLASTDCRTPFADARIVGGFDQYSEAVERGSLGSSAAVQVQLNANGDAVATTLVNVSDDDFAYGNDLVHAAKLIKFQPAIAYCEPVPSSYILRQTVNP